MNVAFWTILFSLAMGQDFNYTQHVTVEKGASEKDESFPKYEIAAKNCSDTTGDYDDALTPFGMQRKAHWQWMNDHRGKSADKMAQIQVSCDAAMNQACMGLDRGAWNLYYKPMFRSGIKKGCVYK